MRTRRTMNKAVSAVLVAAIALAACGDDDEATDTTTGATTPADTQAPPPDTTAAPAPDDTTAADPSGFAGTASAEFCEGFVGIETALKNAPEDPAEMEAFVAEQVTPNLELVRQNLPAEVGADVSVMADAVEQLAQTGDFSVMDTPEMTAASGVVYPYLADGCGLASMAGTAVDYGYEGLPDEVAAGTTVIVLTNESENDEIHEMGLVKLVDGDDISLEELLALPEVEQMEHIEHFGGGVFVAPGATSGTVVDLTPGRWAYVCFIPIGSVHGEMGEGAPHFTAGMAGEFTVA